jgi:hypothetical protein
MVAGDSDREARELKIKAYQGIAPHEGDPAGNAQKRAEGDRHPAVMSEKKDKGDPHCGADQRSQKNDQRQALPSQPGAQRGEQLKIAVAHAFFARYQLENLVNKPE